MLRVCMILIYLVGARGFEPPTSCSQSTLGIYAMDHTTTQHATGSQHNHTVTVTARYRPQRRDTGATVTETGMCGWNRDGNRNGKRIQILCAREQEGTLSAGGGREWSPLAVRPDIHDGLFRTDFHHDK